MTNGQILEKAVKKATENKWVWGDWNKESTLIIWDIYGCKNSIRRGDYYFVIFSHNFAKAFWGSKICYIDTPCDPHVLGSGGVREVEAWKIHLQNMVLKKQPLKYLEKFLKTKLQLS